MGESVKNEILSWIKSIFIAFIIVLAVRHFLFEPSTVYGESMSPTFEDQDKVLVSKKADIQRFDIIVFDAPDSDEKYIKRVIGLPGDSIEMKNNVLYINGEAYNEPYLNRENQHTSTGDFTLEGLSGVDTVPENSLFVLGDNRRISKDSRIFGFVPFNSVIGEVKLRIYPLNQIHFYN